MKVLLLSNNRNAKVLHDLLVMRKNEIILFQNPLTIEIINEINPELVISYNYKHIVGEDVINRLGNRIINLHTSYLPWNRGASPNIWSFIDDTPKGVTIHRLEKELDAGKIILQKKLTFDENLETLSSTYSKLNEEIVNLLIDNWEMISSCNFKLKNQEGEGSYHKSSDLKDLLHGNDIDYSMTIKEFKRLISDCGK
jgi:methionyl-tRNA formyltransferase